MAMSANPLSQVSTSDGHILPAGKPIPAAMSAESLIQASGGPILPTMTQERNTSDPILAAKRKQKNTRLLMMLTTNRVYDVLARNKPSRRGLEALVVELNELMDEAIPIHDFLVKFSGITGKKLDKQQSSHLTYRLLLAQVEDHVQHYLQARADDTVSSNTHFLSLPSATSRLDDSVSSRRSQPVTTILIVIIL